MTYVEPDGINVDWQSKKEFSDIYAEVAREFATEFTKIFFEDFQKVTDNIKWNFKEHDLLLSRQEEIIQRLLALTQVSANRHAREYHEVPPTNSKDRVHKGRHRSDPLDDEKTREISDLAGRACGLFRTCNPAQRQPNTSQNPNIEIRAQFIPLSSEGVEVLARAESDNYVYMVPPPAARSETLMAHNGDTVDIDEFEARSAIPVDIDEFEEKLVMPRHVGDMVAISCTDIPLHIGDMADILEEDGWDVACENVSDAKQNEFNQNRHQREFMPDGEDHHDASKNGIAAHAHRTNESVAELIKEDFYRWKAASMQDQGNGSLQRFVNGLPFRVLVSCLIIANSVLIGVRTESAARMALDRSSANEASSWELVERVFLFLFIAEIGVRMCADRFEFLSGFDGVVNILDVLLVSGAFLDIILEDGFPNISWARLIRILQYLRLLRIIRVLRFFRSVRLMISCIVESLIPLLWILLMLFFIAYFFAIIFLHGVSEHIRDSQLSETSETFLRENCSSISQALLLLFMTVSGGRPWTEFYDSLVSLSWMYGMFFLLYMYFIIVGVGNIITGLFVDTAVHVSQRYRGAPTVWDIVEK